MTRLDRRALFASGAAAALLAASGVCAAPKRGGRLRAALSDELFDRAIASTVYDNLTEIAADGTLHGELSTSWASDQNGRLWRFALREGVTFHDGTPFDANRVTLPFDVQVIDRHTVQLSLEEPNPNLPYLLAHPGYEQRSETGSGTGIYESRKLEEGRHFIGSRVSDHWKRNHSGWFDSVEFVRFSDAGIRAEALRDAFVDVADIVELDVYADERDYMLLPDGQAVTHIASQSIAVPVAVGKTWPLDNFRMAERWWIA